MKKILILIIVLLFTTQTAFAHLENVHQFILYRAYQYIKFKTGKTIPEFEEQIAVWKQNGVFIAAGNDEIKLPKYNDGIPRYWEQSPALSIGIWREDEQDAVWERTAGETSSSHFWVADLGDNALTPLAYGPLGIGIGSFRNSWEKARIYAFGKDKLPGIWQGYIAVEGNYDGAGWGNSNVVRNISYNSLIDIYKTGNYWYHGGRYERFLSSGSSRINPPQYNDAGPLSPQLRKLFAYNLLARISHLLTDMGVPAHVHGDIHACKFNDMDSYEQFMGDKMKLTRDIFGGLPSCYVPYQEAFYANRWTAETAAAQGDFIFSEAEIRSSSHTDEGILRELFYTMNQLSDLFASHRYIVPSPNIPIGIYEPQVDGNTLLPNGNGIKTNLTSIYAQYDQARTNAPPYNGFSEDEYFQMRGDLLMNYAIRATATLLYWFAIRAEVPMLDNAVANPLAVNIDGADELRGGQCGIFSAVLSGTGSGLPATYTWRTRNRVGGVYSRWTTLATSITFPTQQVCMPSAASDIQIEVAANNGTVTATSSITVRRFIPGGPLLVANKLTTSDNNVQRVTPQPEQTNTTESNTIQRTVYGDDVKLDSPVSIVDNTFNFNYAIPRAAAVKVEVFNGKYKRLATVVNATQENGSYAYSFDAKSLPEGAYFVRVAATEVESEFLQRSFLPFYIRRTVK